MALFGPRFPLFAEHDDPPAPGNPPPATPPASAAFSAEQMDAIGKTVNAAITSHTKRQPSIADALKAMNWEETLSPVIAKLAPPPPPKVEHDPAAPPKPDPRLSALEAKYAELETKHAQERSGREKAEQKSRDDSAFRTLTSALDGQVIKGAADSAAKILFYADKRITFDDQGNLLMTVRKAPYAGAPEEDLQLPLADGLKHWLGTEQGKIFVPAPVGDPKRGGGAPGRHVVTGRDGLPMYEGPATSDDEKVRRANERAAALASKYPGL